MKRSFFCLLADLIDIHKLVYMQYEIKGEKELYKRPNCVLPLLPSLCIENWLSHFHCHLMNNWITVGAIQL